ncbi:beta strand repeat-containing protein [Falsiroseomonas stagni]|nr:hypothetical protein [Falsiroseomonas stagni]
MAPLKPMTSRTARALAYGSLPLLLLPLGGLPAAGQTVVNLTNLDTALMTAFAASGSAPAISLQADTRLDAPNLAVSLSPGVVPGFAASALDQRGMNVVNAIGQAPNGDAQPVMLGSAAGPIATPGTVEINTLLSAGASPRIADLLSVGAVEAFSGRTSLTVGNTNAAISSGDPAAVGANGALVPFAQGNGSALVGGSQTALNSGNAVAVALQPGTVVVLNQMPVGLVANGGVAVAGQQQGYLNMSAVNSLLAYAGTGAATVLGGSGGNAGAQVAGNRFNTALVAGDVDLVLAQKADGLNATDTTFQAANRALAFGGNLGGLGLDPAVRTLGQVATVAVNQLALRPDGAAPAGNAQLNGQQSMVTAAGGSSVIPLVTNQIGASNITAGGFVPDSGVLANSRWGSFANSVGVPSLPQPGVTLPAPMVNGAPPASDVAIDRIGQAIELSFNAVDAGSVAIQSAPTGGSAGFSQVSGTVGLAAALYPSVTSAGQTLYFSPQALNSAIASTQAGQASINTASQAYRATVNTIQSQSAILGGFAQSQQRVDFGAAHIVGSQEPGLGGYTRVDPYTGATAEAAGVGPYSLLVGPSASLYANNIRALTALGGSAEVRGTQQQTTAAVNLLATTGTVDTSSAGLISQTAGAIDGFGSPVDVQRGFSAVPMQTVQAASGLSSGSGTATLTDYRQDINLVANAVSGGSLSGTVRQTGPVMGGISGPMETANLASVFANGRGAVTLGGASDQTSGLQQVSMTINRIESAGVIGSAVAPVAIQQASGSAPGVVGTQLGQGPANIAEATALGSSGDATARNVMQGVSISLNSVNAGGTMTGNLNQLSGGLASGTGNLAVATAIGCCQGPGSANATLVNARQVSGQSLNSLTVGALGAGTINQAAASRTDLLSANRLLSQASAGVARITGTQVAMGSVNIVGTSLR